jgi:hypothetical protein
MADDPLPTWAFPYGANGMTKPEARLCVLNQTKVIPGPDEGHLAVAGSIYVENAFHVVQSPTAKPVVVIVVALIGRLLNEGSQLISACLELKDLYWDGDNNEELTLSVTALQLQETLICNYTSCKTILAEQINAPGHNGRSGFTFNELIAFCAQFNDMYNLGDSLDEFIDAGVRRLDDIENIVWQNGGDKVSDGYPGETQAQRQRAYVIDMMRHTAPTRLRNRIVQGADSNLGSMARKALRRISAGTPGQGVGKLARADWIAAMRGYGFPSFPRPSQDAAQAAANALKINSPPLNAEDADFFSIFDHKNQPWTLTVDNEAQAVAIDEDEEVVVEPLNPVE